MLTIVVLLNKYVFFDNLYIVSSMSDGFLPRLITVLLGRKDGTVKVQSDLFSFHSMTNQR
jgi:hypothetical protein